MDLKGQCILLTGASRGIGAAIARDLLKKGATVALHYNRNPESVKQLESKYPDNTRGFKANLEFPEDTIRLVKEVINTMGPVHSIILNAGVFIPHPVDLPEEEWLDIWRKIIAINLESCGLMTKMGIAHFRDNGGGRFIYIGSRAAFRGETQEYLAYAASKGGLTSLARSVARSFGKDNIKSFVVAPGFTRTEMAEEFIAKYGEEKVLKEIALPELTRPEDIAPLVALMCSGQMDHATGTTIDVNAGSHIR
ncbi:SDR family NAD(P)-dependent oxidoreductase [Lentiprolixibacter aurantiacus]|uniref:SDR family NAD(P)-dependent oxidoreductase n=1 Tax=Lentiprolixibacter aurantiacus TaxID=2993939 RepID=A0AAE3MLX9_9FLAO|nr:SDR family oxidoreductase [Lentiprolixibacter aurantiacus]MCX2719618.1 SDR family NAD(P)-dependent oxidoreductase [Lentiprolixibacter aurantiacus]